MIPIRERLKSEVTFRVGFFKILLCLEDRSFHIDELRSVFQLFQPHGRSSTVASRVAPFPHAVIGIMTDKSSPQAGDLIIMQTNEVTGDGSAREAGQKHGLGNAAILLTDAPYAGMPLPVWLYRVNPFGSDRFPAPFTLSLSLFLTQIISYHCLRVEPLFKKLLPQDL